MSSDAPAGDGILEDTAERIAAAVTAVEGVAGLHAGMFGEVATYLPGRRVSGVRIGPDRVDVHVSLVLGVPVRPTAAAIQRAVAELVELPVDVTIEDLVPVTPTPGRGLL
ncbi:Asp23/Gls24 family envelope stress response protein [Mycolicibacterium sp. CBMA 226]|uniref:Asp23/Gls24 family envelope stress response protein n=1 Tax=Mycolicibacterium sp. CBMA 226 TaxID=2606611 RepID=UPI001309D39C|nr:Asp23/Gls24 family envelope stress response protein [Mycolicibacterium sp. CBMA 226]MUL78444.1 Asp23/Gls24 family envelope stress response protein [Mycolicibacterium sp. CBMA 226]